MPAILSGMAGGPGRRVAVAGGDDPASLVTQLAGLDTADASRLLDKLVRGHAAAVLGHVSAATIDATQAFRDLGFDSLTTFELRNRLTAATGLQLPVTLVFEYPTPAELAGYLHDQLVPDRPGSADQDEDAEVKLRQAFAAIPLSRLRAAGVMDILLGLAGMQGEEGQLPGETAETDDGIDALDTQSLIDMALTESDS